MNLRPLILLAFAIAISGCNLFSEVDGNVAQEELEVADLGEIEDMRPMQDAASDSAFFDASDDGFVDAPDLKQDVDAAVPDMGVDMAAPECHCSLRADDCLFVDNDSEPICYRADLECDPEEDSCPQGYSCTDGQCQCSDVDLCGFACKNDDQCGAVKVCDQATDRCRDPLSECGIDADCMADEFCNRDSVNECTLRGTEMEGDSCTSRSDCESGYCAAGLCLSACTSTQDCADGLECQNLDRRTHPYWLVCLPPPNSGARCDDDEVFFANPEGFGTSCVTDWCWQGQDCARGDCTLIQESSGGGALQCSQTASSECGPDEILRPGRFTMDDACFRHEFCWTDLNCPSGYECMTGSGSSIFRLSYPFVDLRLHGVCGKTLQ